MTTLTRIEIEAGPDHADGAGSVRPVCRLRTGLIAPRRLPAGPGQVRIALVAAGALLLAGDQVRIEVDVRGPVLLDLVEVAGTVAYAMRGGRARWDVTVDLTDGAALAWHGEPFVVAAGAEVDRTLTVHQQDGTRARLREIVVLGRSGESGGVLRTSTRAWYGGAVLLAEDLDLAPEHRGGWAMLNGARCLDTLTLLGERLPEAPQVLQLDGPGSIERRIVDELHLSSEFDPRAQRCTRGQ
jgi:urease accessory protein